MEYVRPAEIPAFLDFLDEEGIDTGELRQALDNYLSEAEEAMRRISHFHKPYEYLEAQTYLENIRALQTIFFYEGFRKR